MEDQPMITTYPVKLACVMVGLPARGKTYISRKIVRYFQWLGYPTKIFNVGNYRRDAVGASQPHNFFDPMNVENTKKRMECAMLALQDMMSWFEQEEGKAQAEAKETADQAIQSARKAGKTLPADASMESIRAGGSGFVAVYDATNSTRDRRKLIQDHCKQHGVHVMFIESVCDDLSVIMSNIREVKLSSPDYAGCDPAKAVQDFIKRIRHYEKVYETLTVDEGVSYVKLINVGKQVQMHMIRGYLQSRIVYFLMNLNIVPRNIYFCRHGESEFNVIGRIGGNADLSQHGWAFAEKLPRVLDSIIQVNLFRKNSLTSSSPTGAGVMMQRTLTGVALEEAQASPAITVPPTPLPTEPERVTVWTSSLKRTMQTACKLKYPKMQWKQLDELDSGVCDGLTYEEIEEQYPDDFYSRDQDKYRCAFKNAESYRDLVQRLEPVIMELERHNEPGHSILIIGHQAVLRCIYGYFMHYPPEEIPYIKIPLHTVFKLTPKAYECEEERFPVDVPAVDTHRLKPTLPGSDHKKEDPNEEEDDDDESSAEDEKESQISHSTRFVSTMSMS